MTVVRALELRAVAFALPFGAQIFSQVQDIDWFARTFTLLLLAPQNSAAPKLSAHNSPTLLSFSLLP